MNALSEEAFRALEHIIRNCKTMSSKTCDLQVSPLFENFRTYLNSNSHMTQRNAL